MARSVQSYRLGVTIWASWKSASSSLYSQLQKTLKGTPIENILIDKAAQDETFDGVLDILKYDALYNSENNPILQDLKKRAIQEVLDEGRQRGDGSVDDLQDILDDGGFDRPPPPPLDDTDDSNRDAGGGHGDSDADEDPFDNPIRTPLVIDLDGDGVELVSLDNSTAYFDLNVDGFAERTGWASSDDGFLAFDVNGNGRIDDNTELFGDGTGYSDGFAQLAQHDSNLDSVLDSLDTDFANLLVWRDLNQDGLSQADELLSLSETGIASIDLSAQEIDETNEGHWVSHRSSVTFDDGVTTAIDDVHFENETGDSMMLLPDDFEYVTEALILPTLWGYGQISSTHVALSMDADLLQQATDLVAIADNGDVDAFTATFESFALAWAGVDDIDPQSRGIYVDGRHVAFLEQVHGQAYKNWLGGPEIFGQAGAQLEGSYRELIQSLSIRFLAQTSGASIHLQDDPLLTIEADFAAHPFAALNFLGGDYSPENRALNGERLDDVITAFQTSVDGGHISSSNAAKAVLLTQYDVSETSEEFQLLLQSEVEESGIDMTSDFAVNLLHSLGQNYREGTDGNDTVQSVGTGYLIGGDGDDTLTGYLGDGEVFFAGKGNDTINTLYGYSDDDLFLYRFGDGSDTITDYGYSLNVTDRLKLIDIDEADVIFSATSGHDLVLTMQDGATVTIVDHFRSKFYSVEEIEFSDGTVFHAQDIRNRSVEDQKSSGFVRGSGLDEQYQHDIGDGSYTIFDVSYGVTSIDELVFSDQLADDVAFSQNSGQDLLISASNGEVITITDHFRNDRYDMELIEFSDGTVLDEQAIRNRSIEDQKSGGFVRGSGLDEQYEYASTDGSYTILDHSYSSLSSDSLLLTDQQSSGVTFTQNAGQDLVLAMSSGEVVTIRDHFRNDQYDMETIEFSDGTSLDAQAIRDRTVEDQKSSGNVRGSGLEENYEHSSTDGTYSVIDFTYSSLPDDRFVFTDVTASDLTFTQASNDDLIIEFNDGNTVTIVDQFRSWQYGIEEFEFSDGTVLDADSLLIA